LSLKQCPRLGDLRAFLGLAKSLCYLSIAGAFLSLDRRLIV
jgi:hypothetical protein